MLNAVIIFIVCLSCIPYYFKYEKRKPQTRESVVLAVMIALTVASRMIFAFAPGFKPVSAMVTMDTISDARMGNDRMDCRNFKSEKMAGTQQDIVNSFWNLIWNRIFLCHGYLDPAGSRRWISVYEICGSIRDFGSNNNRILRIKCGIFMDFNACFCKETKQG